MESKIDGGVHDADAVSPDGIGHVTNVDRVQIFVVGGFLHEYLIVEVVKVFGYKYVNVAHNLKDVQALDSERETTQYCVTTFQSTFTKQVSALTNK